MSGTDVPRRRGIGSMLWVPFAVASAAAILLAGAVAAPSAADTSAPTQPGAITVSGVTSNSASLAWGASTDDVKVEGYRVYRGPATAPNSSLSLIATTDAVTSYKATALYAGTDYKFGVVAIDLSNNASPMTTTTFTTSSVTDTTPPAAPSSSSVSGTAFSSSRIDVVWGASSSSDVSGYLIFRNGTQVGRVDLPGGLRYSDNGLAASTNYTYSVKAVDSAGNISSATSGRKVKTLALGTVKIARGPYLANVTANSAVVSWWTNLPTSGTVNYGVASTSEHSVSDLGTVQHHTVTLTGLSGGTTYTYSVVSGSVSSGATFKTASAPGTTFSFAAIGDFGGGSPGETQNASNIAGAGTSFIQTLGDNIYPSSGLPDPDFSTQYSDFDARFFKQFGTAVRSQPFFPANGNKEYYGDGEFWTAFPMLGSNHAWYSYDWGNAHILVVDSEQLFTPGTAQYNFIQNDLAAHQSATWRIVAIQRPPYSSSSANSSSQPVLQYLVPLFDQYNVQLVLSGNSHNYERSYPLRAGNVVTSGGTTYVVSGGGGNGFNSFTIAQPSWSAFREATYYQYAKVTVSPTSLRVDAIRADTNTVFDSTTIQAATSADTTPPTAPTGLNATAPNSTQVNLSWTASTDDVGVTGYQILRGPSGGQLTPLTTTGTGTTYSDTTVAASTSYDYQVKAFDAAGNFSDPSSTATVTTPEGQPPTQPGNFRVSGTPTQTSITVAWDASTDNVGVVGYNVYVGTGPANSTTNTSYTATNLSCGTTYAFAVEAYDAAGNKSTQATLNGTTAACTDTQRPTVPTNLAASAVNASQVNLTWTASTDNVGVTGYQIFRGPHGGGTFTKIATTTGTGTTYSDTTVAASTSYDYQVKALDAAGNLSDPSNTATATTPASVGIAFVDEQNFNGTTGSPTAALSYAGGTGADFYVLIVATPLGATGNITAVTDSGGNTWTRSTQLGVSGGTNTFLSMWRTTTMVAPPGTITVTGIGANAWDAKVVEFSGVGAADATAAPQANATASTSLPTPSTTTTNAGSLLIAAGVTPGSKTGDPAGWTPLSDVTAQTPHIFSAYQLPGVAGTFSAAWTITSAKSTGAIASFLPS